MYGAPPSRIRCSASGELFRDHDPSGLSPFGAESPVINLAFFSPCLPSFLGSSACCPSQWGHFPWRLSHGSSSSRMLTTVSSVFSRQMVGRLSWPLRGCMDRVGEFLMARDHSLYSISLVDGFACLSHPFKLGYHDDLLEPIIQPSFRCST